MDGLVRDLGEAVSQLGKLKSKRGIFFTTGNHEYISGKTPDRNAPGVTLDLNCIISFSLFVT